MINNARKGRYTYFLRNNEKLLGYIFDHPNRIQHFLWPQYFNTMMINCKGSPKQKWCTCTIMLSMLKIIIILICMFSSKKLISDNDLILLWKDFFILGEIFTIVRIIGTCSFKKIILATLLLQHFETRPQMKLDLSTNRQIYIYQ